MTGNRGSMPAADAAASAAEPSTNGFYVAPLPALDDHYNWWATEKCGCSHCEHEACLVCGALIHEYHYRTHQEWHLALAGVGR